MGEGGAHLSSWGLGTAADSCLLISLVISVRSLMNIFIWAGGWCEVVRG